MASLLPHGGGHENYRHGSAARDSVADYLTVANLALPGRHGGPNGARSCRPIDAADGNNASVETEDLDEK
ncbi:hypothetical protein BHQ20_26365 [Mycobacterium intermedium]|nr:hypothetical protein BHQ20_26365 [Mycobacterium intermedium]OPE47582.1 hypothetical protein BV508_21480 [Mycobacterium intermedium]